MIKNVERETPIRRALDIVATEMDGEYLIMSIEQGSYIALRDVSARIWELLEKPQTPAALVEALLGEYEVEPDTCEREVNDFLREMAECNMINVGHIR